MATDRIDLDLTAHEHAAHLRAGDYTSRALTEATLARIHAQDAALNAYKIGRAHV